MILTSRRHPFDGCKFFTGLLAALFLALGSGPSLAASLESEVVELLAKHPQMARARQRMAAADEGIRRRFADFLPTVSIVSDYGYQITDSPTLRNADSSPFTTYPRSSRLTVRQNVFKGFQSESQHEQAKIARALAGIALTSVEQNLLFDGVATYLDVIRRKRLAELSKRNEDIIREQLFLEDERVERGSGISVDVLFAKSRLQIAKERRTVSEGEYLNALATYTKIFNHPADPTNMPIPEIPDSLIPATAAEALEVALAENPTLLDSEKAVDFGKEGIRLAKSPFYPRLDLVGRAEIESNFDGVAGLRRDSSLSLQMSWDLFTGGSTRAETAAAHEGYKISLSERRDTRLNIREDLQLAWDRLHTARARAELLGNAVNIATEVHQARLRLAEVGKDTTINVLDAQSEAFSAKIEATDATFDGHVAVYRLLLAMGRLGPGVFSAK